MGHRFLFSNRKCNLTLTKWPSPLPILFLLYQIVCQKLSQRGYSGWYDDVCLPFPRSLCQNVHLENGGWSVWWSSVADENEIKLVLDYCASFSASSRGVSAAAAELWTIMSWCKFNIHFTISSIAAHRPVVVVLNGRHALEIEPPMVNWTISRQAAELWWPLCCCCLSAAFLSTTANAFP